MSYKRLTPCIFIDGGKAVKWFDNREVVSDDVVALAKYYSEMGADELILFDLSNSDEEHDESIDLMKKIHRVISIPMIAGGNIRRQEDVKKILYAGAKRAMLNFSKPAAIDLIGGDRYHGAERDSENLKIRRCKGRVRYVHQSDGDGLQCVQRSLCKGGHQDDVL